MIKAKLLLLSIGLLLLTGLSACGPNFNTDFEPPPPDAKLDDVFPAKINEWQRVLNRPDINPPYRAVVASYGDGRITINAILAPDKVAADKYFKEAIVPNFDKMKNHFRGNINGKWSASGTDDNGRKWYAWVNQSWIFMISGSDGKNFKSAIAAFKYVEE